MITFNSFEELAKYYNKESNTYEFKEDGQLLDVDFNFHLTIDSHIFARDINALDINALDINAGDINAWDIKAVNINARNINYFAVCYAYKNIECNSIKGRKENAKHFVLDGEITIKPKKGEKENIK